MAQITVTFEIEDENIPTALEKNATELTQDDMLKIMRFFGTTHWNIENSNEKAAQAVNNTLLRLRNFQLFKPIDQRPFPEFVLEPIYERIEENPGEDWTLDKLIEQTYGYFYIDGTMTYTYDAKHALLYIHSFWDQFMDDIDERNTLEDFITNPEIALIVESEALASFILHNIFDDAGVDTLSEKEILERLNQLSNDDIYKMYM